MPAAPVGAAPADVEPGAVALPGRGVMVEGYREVLRNPRNVHGGPDSAPDEAPETASAVPDPAALQRAVAALPAARRAQYDQVLQATRTDPAAQDALGMLAIQGRLVGGPVDQAGQDLLTNLAAFAAQPVQPPLDRGQVLGDLVQELADPAAINQHAANTCAAAVGQMYLAEVDPAEYVRLQAGLMAPAGRVETRDGSVLQREPGTERARDLTGQDNAGPDDRAATARVFQGAVMELANGDGIDYDPIADENRVRATGETFTNAGSNGPTAIMEALTGRSTERISPGRPGQPTRDEAMSRLATAVAQRPQQVNLVLGEGRNSMTHALLVQRMDANHVYYRNPWGTEERMSRSEFQARLNNMFVN